MNIQDAINELKVKGGGFLTRTSWGFGEGLSQEDVLGEDWIVMSEEEFMAEEEPLIGDETEKEDITDIVMGDEEDDEEEDLKDE
jgi:hypothetical protein